VTTTPDTDRQARRDAIRDLITRIGRGRAGPDIATLLTSHLDAEQADGDQAREQLAAARAGDGKGRTASDVLVEHDVTRKALCDALGVGYHLNWQQIIDTAQRSHDANAAWQAEAEQHRMALCEALACFPSTRWGDLPSIAAERIEQRQRAEDRAEAAEAGERRAMEQRQQMAAERFAWQERGDRAEISARAHKTAATEALQRAERAEATLTAVRKIVSRLAAHAAGFQDVLDAADIGPWGKTVGADLADLQAALGDPQSATEPGAQAAPTRSIVLCGRTTTHPTHLHMLNRQAHRCPGLAVTDLRAPATGSTTIFTLPDSTKTPEPEQAAAPPTVSVIDALAAALVAAGRRILLGDTP
jgi:hypothetical protein